MRETHQIILPQKLVYEVELVISLCQSLQWRFMLGISVTVWIWGFIFSLNFNWSNFCQLIHDDIMNIYRLINISTCKNVATSRSKQENPDTPGFPSHILYNNKHHYLHHCLILVLSSLPWPVQLLSSLSLQKSLAWSWPSPNVNDKRILWQAPFSHARSWRFTHSAARNIRWFSSLVLQFSLDGYTTISFFFFFFQIIPFYYFLI